MMRIWELLILLIILLCQGNNPVDINTSEDNFTYNEWSVSAQTDNNLFALDNEDAEDIFQDAIVSVKKWTYEFCISVRFPSFFAFDESNDLLHFTDTSPPDLT